MSLLQGSDRVYVMLAWADILAKARLGDASLCSVSRSLIRECRIGTLSEMLAGHCENMVNNESRYAAVQVNSELRRV